ncbi:MAG: hypothetical protein JWO09_14 [Bacteroidetes bacterium]|nr:hypothetical protein [Bacteroidota bacterium]
MEKRKIHIRPGGLGFKPDLATKPQQSLWLFLFYGIVIKNPGK